MIEVDKKDNIISEHCYPMSGRHGNDEGKYIINESIEGLKICDKNMVVYRHRLALFTNNSYQTHNNTYSTDVNGRGRVLFRGVGVFSSLIFICPLGNLN